MLFQISCYFYNKESRCKDETLMSATVGKLSFACETSHKYVRVSFIFNFISEKVNRYVKIFTDIYKCI